MSQTSSENFHKLTEIHMRCCSSVLRNLLQKYIAVNTPKDDDPELWALDDFLSANMVTIMSRSEGMNNKSILFPGHRKSTNIKDWNMHLLCFILLNVCKFPEKVREGIVSLKKLRTKLFHRVDMEVTDDDFLLDLEIIKASLVVFFGYLDNKNQKQELFKEIDEIVDKNKMPKVKYKDPYLAQLRINQMAEKNGRNRIQSLSEDKEQTYRKLIDVSEAIPETQKDASEHDSEDHYEIDVNDSDQTYRKVPEISSVLEEHHRKDISEAAGCGFTPDGRALPPRTTAKYPIKLPDVVVEIAMEKCSLDESRKRRISNDLVAIVNNKINTDLTLSDLTDQQKQAIRSTFHQVFREYGGFEADFGCMRVYISPRSVSTAWQLMSDCVSGKLTSALQPVQDIVRTIPGFETYEHDVVLYEEDYTEFTNELEKRLSVLVDESGCELLHATPPSVRRTISDIGQTSRNTILLKIRSSSVEEAKLFKKDVRDGTVQKFFKPLENVIKDVFGMESLSLHVGLAEDRAVDPPAGTTNAVRGIIARL